MRAHTLNFNQIGNNYGKYGQTLFTLLCEVGPSLNLLIGILRFFKNLL